ncbi:hypothetical protein V6N13_145383 [Hibiscus sabdariffa]|uniref:Reverse transcriptase Ty1/copia-type domain-containing protein n=1 Tax=Hibiscus sabdariffa TaxID=183260 RepID=A0ABR2TPN2_9ROSI
MLGRFQRIYMRPCRILDGKGLLKRNSKLLKRMPHGLLLSYQKERELYKARLVAKGFSQTQGVDFNETFAPVAKLNTVRVLISLAVNLDWPLHQLDVKNAFLNGNVDEEVYMTIPPGLQVVGGSNKVCKLNRSLYGLKQSPRAWFEKFTTVILQHGFSQSLTDHTLFFKMDENGQRTILLVYVDDIILTGDDTKEIVHIKGVLRQMFETKDLGQLRYFLGMEVARSKAGIVINQRKYVLDLLKDTGLLGCKPVDTPMDANISFNPTSTPCANKERFQNIVGKLLYLSHTRPDITFAVNVLSQHMHQPSVEHMQATLRVLKYLKGTPGHGLIFRKSLDRSVKLYTDSSWAGSLTHRRSTSGYCSFLWGNMVTWRSKKQAVISRSSAEAEFRALAQGICEGIWLLKLLKDIHPTAATGFELFSDNKSAIQLAKNPVQHDRTKHVEIDRHFIQENLKNGVVTLSYTQSAHQLADIFTKALPRQSFVSFLGKLGIYNIYTPA